MQSSPHALHSLHCLSTACRRCLVCFVLGPTSMHGPKTKHTKYLTHKRMKDGVCTEVSFILCKKDPGRARQNSLATAGTNFTKPGVQNKGDLCRRATTFGCGFPPPSLSWHGALGKMDQDVTRRRIVDPGNH